MAININKKLFAVALTEFDIYVVVSWNPGGKMPEFSQCSQRIVEIFSPYFSGFRAEEKAHEFRARCADHHGKKFTRYRALLRMTGDIVDRDFDKPLSFVEATRELGMKKSHLIDFFLLNTVIEKESGRQTHALFPRDQFRAFL